MNLFIHSFIDLKRLGAAPVQGGGAASHLLQLMSLNLNRNVVAMEKALRHLAEAERSLEECSSCLVPDVKFPRRKQLSNRSIADARNGLFVSIHDVWSQECELGG